MPEDVLPSDPHGGRLRSVVLPFIIFTAIWGSTWIVIRGQIGIVPPQWSVTYRFVIAAVAMALVARWKGESLRLGRKGLLAAAFLGFTQFCVNFNAVYLAERHITSGVVATVFALLLIPAACLAGRLLGQRPSRALRRGSRWWLSRGIVLLFIHEVREHPARRRADRCRHRHDALSGCSAHRSPMSCRRVPRSAVSRCSRCSPGRWRRGDDRRDDRASS